MPNYKIHITPTYTQHPQVSTIENAAHLVTRHLMQKYNEKQQLYLQANKVTNP